MRVSGIERGAECARYKPLLSALADGEASAEDLARLRPHMQACLSCRAAPAGVPDGAGPAAADPAPP
jgi:predicted anti-sigma-YlaC factor YlaD